VNKNKTALSMGVQHCPLVFNPFRAGKVKLGKVKVGFFISLDIRDLMGVVNDFKK
jgi:hypothetical protein